MLEGNELEQVYDGGAGKLIVDVTGKGEVKISNVYQKDLGGYAKVKNTTELESSIFHIAYQATKKTGITWDEKLVEGLAKLLGIDLAEAQVLAANILPAPAAPASEEQKA